MADQNEQAVDSQAGVFPAIPGTLADRVESTGPPETVPPETVGLLGMLRSGMTPPAAKVALVALGSDLVFAVIRAWQLFSRESAGKWFRLDVDGSLPEIVQYGKFLVIAALMVRLARTTALRWYLVWAASFAFLMLDDSLMIHERFGESLKPRLASRLPAGTDLQAVAELGYFAVIGGLIVVFAMAGVVLSPGPFRRLSIDLILLLGIGAVFAIGVDLIHGLLSLGYVGNSLFAVVEDGGEMLVVSLIVVYSTMVDGHEGRLPHWLTDVRRLGR